MPKRARLIEGERTFDYEVRTGQRLRDPQTVEALRYARFAAVIAVLALALAGLPHLAT